MKAILFLAALTLISFAVVWSSVKLSAAEQPHLTAGPGTPPSVTALAAEVHAYRLENETLRVENAALKAKVSALEATISDVLQARSRESGLRQPPSHPSGKLP